MLIVTKLHNSFSKFFYKNIALIFGLYWFNLNKIISKSFITITCNTHQQTSNNAHNSKLKLFYLLYHIRGTVLWWYPQQWFTDAELHLATTRGFMNPEQHISAVNALAIDSHYNDRLERKNLSTLNGVVAKRK